MSLHYDPRQPRAFAAKEQSKPKAIKTKVIKTNLNKTRLTKPSAPAPSWAKSDNTAHPSTRIKQRIWQIVNAFETGRREGQYHALTVQADGRKGSRQISYGRHQVTEQGHLHTLLSLYCQRQGRYAKQLAPYVNQLKRRPLAQDKAFKLWLIKAGKTDPIMAQCQDTLFDRYYWQPALNWANREGFSYPLSTLVIYDSYIHSGHILAFLRKRFAAATPKNQGSEQLWISQYTQTRHAWLTQHSNPLLRASRYRTQCLLDLIKQNNWQLDQLPIIVHGVTIT